MLLDCLHLWLSNHLLIKTTCFSSDLLTLQQEQKLPPRAVTKGQSSARKNRRREENAWQERQTRSRPARRPSRAVDHRRWHQICVSFEYFFLPKKVEHRSNLEPVSFFLKMFQKISSNNFFFSYNVAWTTSMKSQSRLLPAYPTKSKATIWSRERKKTAPCPSWSEFGTRPRRWSFRPSATTEAATWPSPTPARPSRSATFSRTKQPFWIKRQNIFAAHVLLFHQSLNNCFWKFVTGFSEQMFYKLRAVELSKSLSLFGLYLLFISVFVDNFLVWYHSTGFKFQFFLLNVS